MYTFFRTVSTKRSLERMPFMADVHAYGPIEQEAALIIGLYGNQANLLKHRFGEKGKAMHQKNISFSVERNDFIRR